MGPYFCSKTSGKGKYKESGIVHSLDIWHGVKDLEKRLQAVRNVLCINVLSDLCVMTLKKKHNIPLYIGWSVQGMLPHFTLDQGHL